MQKQPSDKPIHAANLFGKLNNRCVGSGRQNEIAAFTSCKGGNYELDKK